MYADWRIAGETVKFKNKNKKNNFRYLPQAVFVALMLVGTSKFLKQII